jgi:hypothetical protein
MPVINKLKKLIMKKIFFYSFLFLLFASGGCIKNKLTTWNGALAEIDLAAWNANGPAVTYPFVTRVPAANRALTSSCPDSTLRRYAGTIRVRVNLVGGHSSKDETVGYTTFTSPVATVSFPATIAANSGLGCATAQTPSASAATLNVLDAVAGTHYAALSGTVTIPKDSSFGYINIQILNPGATASQARFLGIQLNGNGTVKPSVNYSQVGLFIDQR